MRKNKTWAIYLFNQNAEFDKSGSEQIQSNNFYTSDTEAYLNFTTNEGFEFDSATIAILNKDDGSIFERPMAKEDNTAVYKIESDVIEHFGLCQTQVLFKKGGEIFTSMPVTFTIERYMMADRPPRVEDVVSWKELYDNATETILQFNDIIKELSEEKDFYSLPEIAGARGGFNTLGERLDNDRNDVVRRLEHKVGGGNKAELEDLSEEVLGAISGSTEFNLLSIPQDHSVSYDKLVPDLQESLVIKVHNLAPELSYSNWKIPAHEISDSDTSIKLITSTNLDWVRMAGLINEDFKVGDKIFVRVRMEVLNSEASAYRVHLREDLVGTFYKSVVVDNPTESKIETIYFTHEITQNTSNLHLMVDTVYYGTKIAGRETLVYEASFYKVDEFLDITNHSAVEKFNERTMKSTNLFNSKETMNRLDTIEFKLDKTPNIEMPNDITIATSEVYRKASGEVISRNVDKYAYPNNLTWGNEYLYSWYKALEDNKNLTMLWSGDSTTENAANGTGYKRHELGKNILTKYGYNNVESINVGHGANTSVQWKDRWLLEDLTTIENAITENRLPLYILGWGINDGGLNYNSGTSIEQRVERFKTALNEGLANIRNQYTADQLPIILATPVTTYDLTNKRNNKEWHDHIRHIIHKASREHQCAFIDLGLYHYDRTYSDVWSTGGDKVHPNRYATKDYMSLFKDLLVPELFERQTTKPNLLPNGDFQGVIGSHNVDGWSAGTMATGGIIQLMESPWGTQGVNALKMEVVDQRAYLASPTKYPITGGKIYTLSCVANGDPLEVWYEFSNAQGERILHETNRQFTDVGNSRYTITLLSPYEATDISITRIGLGVTSNSIGSVIFERLRLDLGESV